jgi:hypothetical protein
MSHAKTFRCNLNTEQTVLNFAYGGNRYRVSVGDTVTERGLDGRSYEVIGLAPERDGRVMATVLILLKGDSGRRSMNVESLFKVATLTPVHGMSDPIHGPMSARMDALESRLTMLEIQLGVAK